MKRYLQALQQRLDEREAQNLTRTYFSYEAAMGPRLTIQGQEVLCFSSNDYLGHANHPKIKEALKSAVDHYGVSGGASHAVCGHSRAHAALENKFASLLNRDEALFFTNGYMANLAVMSALADKSSQVLEDKWNHASLLDGGLLSGARFGRYLHNDSADLERRLRKSQDKHTLVCADTVFSMDGDLCDLPSLLPVIEQHDALLYLDDAHGFGVLGDKGHGIIDYGQYSQDKLPLVMITLGKALGSFGAIVVGHKTLIETVRQFARSYIYTTSLPPALAEATSVSLDLLEEESFRRLHLHKLINVFKEEVKLLGLTTMPSDTPIQPIVLGDAETAMAWQAALREHSILVNAIRPPTVPEGSSRLRVTLSASHSEADLEKLLLALKSIQQSSLVA